MFPPIFTMIRETYFFNVNLNQRNTFICEWISEHVEWRQSIINIIIAYIINRNLICGVEVSRQHNGLINICIRCNTCNTWTPMLDLQPKIGTAYYMLIGLKAAHFSTDGGPIVSAMRILLSGFGWCVFC